jgi:hypothetical protein
MSYTPTYAGDDINAANEFARLAQALNGDRLQLQVWHSEPPLPRLGDVVVADGTDWDPTLNAAPTVVWFNGSAWARV